MANNQISAKTDSATEKGGAKDRQQAFPTTDIGRKSFRACVGMLRRQSEGADAEVARSKKEPPTC